MNSSQISVLDATLPSLSAFKRAFGRDPSSDFLAELYVARELGLDLANRRNEPGSDAVDANGHRYQVKFRSSGTLNVDTNNLDFDFIVLVNVG